MGKSRAQDGVQSQNDKIAYQSIYTVTQDCRSVVDAVRFVGEILNVARKVPENVDGCCLQGVTDLYITKLECPH
jgi:hypothetical protein